VAERLTDHQVQIVLELLSRTDPGPRGHCVPITADIVNDLATSREVKLDARVPA
jgi:hypothetical protein